MEFALSDGAPSLASRDDSLGGGVGGFATAAVIPRAPARCSSRRICGSCSAARGPCGPETVACRLGTVRESGAYRLTLRSRPCRGLLGPSARSSATDGEGLPRRAALRVASRLVLGLSERSSGGIPSAEGRRVKARQGPGEWCAMSGEGRGVMSPRADIIGLGMMELEPEPLLPGPPSAFLMLGVRDTGTRLELEAW